MSETEKKSNGKNYLPSAEALVELAGEYLLKGMVVLTGCVITVISVWYYFHQFIAKTEKPIDIKDVLIIGGLGFGVIVKFYFGGVKAKKPPSKRS